MGLATSAVCHHDWRRGLVALAGAGIFTRTASIDLIFIMFSIDRDHRRRILRRMDAIMSITLGVPKPVRWAGPMPFNATRLSRPPDRFHAEFQRSSCAHPRARAQARAHPKCEPPR